MEKFVRCARTGVYYALRHIHRFVPDNATLCYTAFGTAEDGDRFAAHIYPHEVEELASTYVPATPGQRVIEVNYGDGEFFHLEVPLVAWRLCEGEIEPIGPEGKVAAGCNSTWVVLLADGRYMHPEMGVSDTLEEALQLSKEVIERNARGR
jgi:hypothetical protein